MHLLLTQCKYLQDELQRPANVEVLAQMIRELRKKNPWKLRCLALKRLSTRWRSCVKWHQTCGIASISPEGYFGCFHSPSGCLGEPWRWVWSFYRHSVCFPSRTEISAASSVHQGTGRCRRVDLTRCSGWSGRNTADTRGKWNAPAHRACQSATGTQICTHPLGGRVQTRQWSWRWSRPGCRQFCAARGRRGRETVGGSRRCGLKCSFERRRNMKMKLGYRKSWEWTFRVITEALKNILNNNESVLLC